jgi:hypothetical protein
LEGGGAGYKGRRLCSLKKFIVTKSKEVKTECDLAESYTESYGSKSDVLPVAAAAAAAVVVVTTTKTIELFKSKIRQCEMHQKLFPTNEGR